MDDPFDTNDSDEPTAQPITTTELTADSPEAVVSQVGNRFTILGTDNGQTTYANDLDHPQYADLISETINKVIKELEDDEAATLIVNEETGMIAIEGPVGRPQKQSFITRTLAGKFARVLAGFAIGYALAYVADRVYNRTAELGRKLRGDDQ